MKDKRHPAMMRTNHAHGYTLLEVLIVVAIVGILATGVVFMFANPSARVKNQVFTLLAELNMARSVAVSENENVLVEFIDNVDGTEDDGDAACSEDDLAQCTGVGTGAGTFDGYIICIDDDDDLDCTDEAADNIVGVTLFDEKIQLYDTNATDANGDVPNLKPGTAVALDVEDGADDDDDGVVFVSGSNNDNAFYFTTMGTAQDSDGNALGSTGYVYIYYPHSFSERDKARGTPYAITVAQSTGNIRIWRWTEGAWRTK